MTERHAGYVVTLGEDVRVDDAEAIITALSMVKGVIMVQPVTGDTTLQMATARARVELQAKVIAACFDEP